MAYSMNDLKIQESTEKKLSAIVALLAAYMEEPETQKRRKVETILSDVGLSNADIANMVGKKTDTVKKIIKRAKK